MNYLLSNQKAPNSLLILGFFSKPSDNEALKSHGLDAYLNTELSPQKEATSLILSTDKGPVMLVNLGDNETFTPLSLQKVCAHITSMLKTLETEAISICFPPFEKDLADATKKLIIALDYALYEFEEFKSEKKGSRIKTVTLISKAPKEGLDEGVAIARGVALTRNLANKPANHLTPTMIANFAQEMASENTDLSITVLNEKDMAKKGMNAILAVSQGSDEEAQFIDIRYEQGGDTPPIVLVGKGITFDSGGLSLKPPTGMTEMKYDMCGAATVLGVIKAVTSLKLPINLIGLIAASENLPGPHALKPGDIITSYSKQTIEVLNTDAEGRLVLSDALTYAEQFKPSKVIDIATLTGAMIIALGYKTNGVMGNNDALCQALCEAGLQIGDKAWQLPLWEEYQSLLDSNIADMSNISSDKSAGSITAGCFLARFAKAYDWAHIDCAGTAWVSGNQKNGTGRPVPLLTQFLMNQVA